MELDEALIELVYVPGRTRVSNIFLLDNWKLIVVESSGDGHRIPVERHAIAMSRLGIEPRDVLFCAAWNGNDVCFRHTEAVEGENGNAWMQVIRNRVRALFVNANNRQ
jgi:hypothetical protein